MEIRIGFVTFRFYETGPQAKVWIYGRGDEKLGVIDFSELLHFARMIVGLRGEVSVPG